MTHTPGPWKVRKYRKTTHLRVGTDTSAGDSFVICELKLLDTNGLGYDSEDLANADLIAAAPELLAALTAIVNAVDDEYQPAFSQRHYFTADDQFLLIRARAAIAKAKGDG